MARSIISRDIGLKKNRRRFSFNFSLVFTDRYEKEYFDLETNVDVIVGGALCLENKYEEKNEEYLISHSQYMLIGRIEKINVGNNQLNS